jgi:hypothetical protein
MRVEYHIYKEFFGVKFPGEEWDGPFSLTKARRVFKKMYAGEKTVFHIIKVTYEDVPAQNKPAPGDKLL